MMILSFVCSSLSSLSSSARLHHSFSLWWWYHPLFLKAHKIVPSFSVHRTKVRRRRLSGKGERSRWRGRLILSINPKNSFIDHVSFPLTKSLWLSLSLSKGKKTREKNEKRRTTTTKDDECCDDARVCVTFSRKQKGVVCGPSSKECLFFGVFFQPQKKKGRKKGRLFRVFCSYVKKGLRVVDIYLGLSFVKESRRLLLPLSNTRKTSFFLFHHHHHHPSFKGVVVVLFYIERCSFMRTGMSTYMDMGLLSLRYFCHLLEKNKQKKKTKKNPFFFC